MTLLTPGGYSKGDVGRKDTVPGEEYPFYNSVIVHYFFGLFFFCSSTLYSMGCGCLFITTQKAENKICFLPIFILCLMHARIASASPPLAWPPPSPASSQKLYSVALCTVKVLAKHVPDAICECYRHYHQIQKSSFMELFLLARNRAREFSQARDWEMLPNLVVQTQTEVWCSWLHVHFCPSWFQIIYK